MINIDIPNKVRYNIRRINIFVEESDKLGENVSYALNTIEVRVILTKVVSRTGWFVLRSFFLTFLSNERMIL